MTDRELLELAAKAAGYDCAHSLNDARMEMDPPEPDLAISASGRFLQHNWNPLIEAGEAFRLALQLGIQVWRDGDILWVGHRAIEFTDIDIDARRAIVVEAAEIGKKIA